MALAPSSRNKRTRRFVKTPMAFVLLWLGAMATSTCAGRGFFTFPLEGSAAVWPQGVVPTTVEVAALSHIRVNDQPIFRQQGIDALDVHGLKPRQVGLVMEAPTASPGFSYVRQIVVVARAEGLPDVVIATGENLAGGTNYVGLEVADVDLTRYARRNNLSFAGIISQADAPPVDTTVRLVLDMEAFVAQPGAACWQK